MEEQEKVAQLVSAAELVYCQNDAQAEQARDLVEKIRALITEMREARNLRISVLRERYARAVLESHQAVRPLKEAAQAIIADLDRYIAEQQARRVRRVEHQPAATAGNGAAL